MKRFLMVSALLLAVPAHAGVTYDFQSKSSGMQQATMTGTVAVEGQNIRMAMKSGDNMLFKDNSLILSNDAGKTLSVFDPAAKTYYVINFNDMLGGMGSMMNSLGGSVKLAFTNPKVAVRDLGDGGPLSGYPTRRSMVDTSYDITIGAMGGTMTTHMTMSTESWSTDRLSGELMNFLQMKNLRTGFPELDKLIEAQTGSLKGGFPLKQITTIHVQQGGNDMTSTTTSEVSNIAKKTFAASDFAAPSGYVKVDDPITRMLKNVR